MRVRMFVGALPRDYPSPQVNNNQPTNPSLNNLQTNPNQLVIRGPEVVLNDQANNKSMEEWMKEVAMSFASTLTSSIKPSTTTPMSRQNHLEPINSESEKHRNYPA